MTPRQRQEAEEFLMRDGLRRGLAEQMILESIERFRANLNGVGEANAVGTAFQSTSPWVATSTSAAPTLEDIVVPKTKKSPPYGELKVRHFTKSERQRYHSPAKDWIVNKGKEVCRSTSVLEVDDLLE